MKYLLKKVYPLLCILSLLTSCIKEDLSDCQPAGTTRLQFSYATPCNPVPAYPADIDSLHLFVFDTRGIFTGEYIQSGVRLSEDYSYEITLPQGEHTIVTWAGKGNACQTVPEIFIAGTTTFNEVVLSLRKSMDFQTGFTDSVLVSEQSLYFGSQTVKTGTNYTVNLTKNTTGINVSVSGLKPESGYRLSITGDDLHYKFDNSFTSSGKLNYIQPLLSDAKGKAGAYIDMLNPGKGDHPVITISRADGSNVFSRDLVDLITKHMPDVNFDCINNFDVEIVFPYTPDDSTTDMSVTITINGWELSEEENNFD